jgi:Family of unknown function (DUF5719)
MAARLVPAAAVLLALGGIAGAAQLAGSAGAGTSHPATTMRQVPVTAAARACPPSPGTGPGKVALIAAPAGAGATAAPAATEGQAELTALPPAGATVASARPVTLANPGLLALLTAPAASSTRRGDAAPPQGVAVSATGAMARAVEAEQADGSGVGSIRCGEPGSDIWFIGPGDQDGAAQIQLDLMNIDAVPATVNVTIITDAGPVQSDAMDGISVPPHTMVAESLAGLAGGGSTAVAVDVRTSVGRVAADLLDGSGHGGTSSWLPAAAAPSRTLVVPGVPSSGSAAGLFLVVPGGSDARVSVLAITPQGLYRPFGSQTIDLPGQSASYVSLTPLAGATSALEITANVPVTAAAGVTGNGAYAFTAATAPVSQQAIVAGNVSGSGLAADIALSAPAAAARVRITETAAGAASTNPASPPATSPGTVVPVRGGHTVVVPVSAPHGSKRGSPFAVVVTPLPGSGPLYAARIETQGQDAVASIIPAASAPVTIGLPPVRDSYDAVDP